MTGSVLADTPVNWNHLDYLVIGSILLVLVFTYNLRATGYRYWYSIVQLWYSVLNVPS